MGTFLMGFAVFGACVYALAAYMAVVDSYFSE